MKVDILSGAALDWAVAKCEGISLHGDKGFKQMFQPSECHPYHWEEYTPTKNWAQGGPIIELEVLSVEPFKDRRNDWRAFDFKTGNVYAGETALIAAMRCYVASKLGDDIDIPKELT